VGKTILLAGGGTAGHVSPLLATAAELTRRGHLVVALGTATGLEADLVPRAGVAFRAIPRVPFPRGITGAAIRFPAAMAGALRATGRILDELAPDVVVGFGGYVSTPAYLVAHRRGVPIVVHEANSKAGLANRLGARYAAGVATNYASTELKGAVVIGMPLREEIVALAEALRDPHSATVARIEARLALRWPDDARAVLVMGGSLGASRLNSATAEAIPAIVGHGIHVLHITGRGKDDSPARALGDLAAKYRTQYVVREYEHDMARAYAAVDAVVCRAGAVTVAEVSALGLPALYVPLPIGNGEQALNAAPAVAAGAALLIENEWLTSAAVTLALEEILLDEDDRARITEAARSLSVLDGSARLADMIEGVAP
jgi:UDP-N-acetylglucosamine--N-acetylmuramyl-(pentapeptide) pyrophosphoryl-undecaprenol N-acetylglucosamine transferase